jgi:DNA-binding response OmpR family regulator/chromosome segregation ATPase
MAGTVLIIDAEEGFAGQLAAILRDHGLESQQTGDGKIGMDLAKEHEPQAIVLCVELPRMSGYSICAKLKKDAQLKSIPLIITSAEATPETFEHHKKLKTRAEEYLKKPFPPSLLLQVLERYIRLPKKAPVNGHGDDLAEELSIEAEPPNVLADEEVFSADEVNAVGADERQAGDMRAIDEVLSGLQRPTQHGGSAANQQRADFEEEDEIMTSVGFIPPGAAAGWESMKREIDDLKTQLQAAREAERRAESRANERSAIPSHIPTTPPGAPSAARETLALKKELNTKDKEILDLKDKLHAKDKELLEQKDREMELEARVVQADEEKAEADALRDAADHRARQADEHAHASDQKAADSDKKARESEQKAQAADRRAQQADNRSKEADQRAQQAAERAQAAETARTEMENILAEAQQQNEQMVNELNRRLGEAATHEAELDGALQAAQQDAAQLREVIAEHEATIGQQQEHIGMLRNANQASNQEITRINNELSAATAEAESLRQQLQSAQQTIEDLQSRIQGLDHDLEGSRGENDGLRSTVQEMEHDREVAEGRIARAYQKIRDDEKIKGKARKAIEIALALLQEAGYSPDAEAEEEDGADQSADEARS